MNKAYIIYCMVFFHILDDYVLQDILANLKQKSWWEKNYPDKMYENDYLMALVTHAFSWTFNIMIPVVVCLKGNLPTQFYTCFAINMFIHAMVDDLKANRKKINLITDQTIHLIQIFVTAFVLL